MKAYAARKDCGCLVAAIVDDEKYRKQTASIVKLLIEADLAIERTSAENVADNFRECRCGQEDQIGMDFSGSDGEETIYTHPEHGDKIPCPLASGQHVTARQCQVDCNQLDACDIWPTTATAPTGASPTVAEDGHVFIVSVAPGETFKMIPREDFESNDTLTAIHCRHILPVGEDDDEAPGECQKPAIVLDPNYPECLDGNRCAEHACDVIVIEDPDETPDAEVATEDEPEGEDAK